MHEGTKYTNHLLGETSPYLEQHAHNPVEWYPWGEEALARARREDKPILLSIGYSACHWCHVMAHESFEDPATAELMNALFVNVKVDREERPDLDKIYQTSHQLLAQRPGGWPLTMFLTPDDHLPFFGGTYFPPAPRHGLPAFRDLLQRVAEVYREQNAELRRQNGSLVEVLQSLNPGPGEAGATLTRAPLDSVLQELEDSFDARHGGFGRAPKFPHPASLECLLRHGYTGEGAKAERSAYLAGFTLGKMALGGIYDQLGGGFCRYSVDERWMIPHFEKMLYDNGPLLALYTEASLASTDELFRRVALETGAWVMREMQSPQGGYYSTLDADSEGEEGRFYVWTREQARQLLNEEQYALFARRFGLDRPSNFEGHWHLHVYTDFAALARDAALPEPRVRERVDEARAKLFAARALRVRPGRDEKILTSWNGLMIKGMAAAGRHLARPAFVDSAQRAVDFIRATLWQDGRLLATCKDGRAHLNAYLDDYAFLIDGLLELLQARWRRADLDFAVALADVVLARFEDARDGGFFFTANDHERLIHRPKPFADESTPSGNGIAALALGRLGHLLGEGRYLDAAARTLRAAWPALSQLPHAHTTLVLALEEHLEPPQTVVLRGTPGALEEWQRICARDYTPRRMTLAIPAEEPALPGLLGERTPRGEAVAYVCTGTACQAPVEAITALEAALGNGQAR